MAGAQYDPKAITFTLVHSILGSHTVTGYQDGTMIVAERTEDLNTITGGSQGDFAFTLKRNRIGTFTISLLQTSPTNTFLSNVAQSDHIAGQGVLTAQLKDHSSGSVSGASVVKIQKHSTMEFSNEVVVREWILLAGELQMLEGEYTAL